MSSVLRLHGPAHPQLNASCLSGHLGPHNCLLEPILMQPQVNNPHHRLSINLKWNLWLQRHAQVFTVKPCRVALRWAESVTLGESDVVLMPTVEAMSISGVGQVSSLPTQSLQYPNDGFPRNHRGEKHATHKWAHTLSNTGIYTHASSTYCNLQRCMTESVRWGWYKSLARGGKGDRDEGYGEEELGVWLRVAGVGIELCMTAASAWPSQMDSLWGLAR